MNLDAFWSRVRRTVNENRLRTNQTLECSRLLGLSGPYEHAGPYPAHDHCGYEMAAAILMRSRRPGKYHKTHTQYETIRMLKTTYNSHVRSTPQANYKSVTMVDKKGQIVRISDDKCNSLWFSAFMMGLKIRMGHTYKPNVALSHQLLMKLLQKAEDRILELEGTPYQPSWIVFVGYVVITYVLSLRGNEGQMLEVEGLLNHWEEKRDGYFIVSLWGKIKGEESVREHQIPCINVTKSGINVKYVVERLLDLKSNQGIKSGPAISDKSGLLMPIKDIDAMLHELLIEIFNLDRTFFPPSCTSEEQIVDSYKCYRTFRRTSDTRAIEEKVEQADIDIVNKWEHRGPDKRKVSQPMRHHYAQFELLVKPFLRYTFAM